MNKDHGTTFKFIPPMQTLSTTIYFVTDRQTDRQTVTTHAVFLGPELRREKMNVTGHC